MGQRDCDVGEVVLTVDDGGECVDGSEAQNQPISVVQRFLTELCKFWSDGWMIRNPHHCRSRKITEITEILFSSRRLKLDACARIKKLISSDFEHRPFPLNL